MKLLSAGKRAVYCHTDTLFVEAIGWALIEIHCHDIIQVILSIRIDPGRKNTVLHTAVQVRLLTCPINKKSQYYVG